jgi:hypothetical protein
MVLYCKSLPNRLLSESNKTSPDFYCQCTYVIVLYFSVVADESELNPPNTSSDFGPVPPHSGKSLLHKCPPSTDRSWGCTLERKYHLCIPILGIIMRLRSQFPHSCVCVSNLYCIFPGSSTYINRSQTHECGNWECGRAIPFLGIYVSNFRYWLLGVGVWECVAVELVSSVCK